MGSNPTRAGGEQMWWTTQLPGAVAHLPVLVTRTFEEDGGVWHDVVPVWPDTDQATWTDLLLVPTDTSTGVHWRVMFRYQGVAHHGQLGRLFGRLTPAGSRLLAQAKDGLIAPHRRGTPLTGPDDSRLTVDEWIGEAVRQLTSRYARRHD